MPSVILLDVSLSMTRPVQTTDQTESHTRFSLAITAINTYLDYLSSHSKLEYVSLITFSSLYEVVVQFTRDYDIIRTKLQHVEEGDKTCIEQALFGINQIVLNEWGYQTPVQIIIVTDGCCGVGTIGRNKIMQALPLPPPYPARIHILPIASPQDSGLPHALPLYQKIVDQASIQVNCSATSYLPRGSIYCPDQLSVPGVCSAMTRLCEQQYTELVCTLHCGQLGARVGLFPPPQPALDENGARIHLGNDLYIVGFVSLQDLGTPVAISKHTVIPLAQINNNERRDENYEEKKSPIKSGDASSSENSNSSPEEDPNIMDPSKVPNFCVLLHGALKVAGMAGIVRLGSRWWGTVVAFCDSARARRSCLLLTALAPGTGPAPWLGPLTQLGPASSTAESFPIRAARSYSGGGGAAWVRSHALLADVQKVLRHARKLPEKTQQLYKELNRLRRSAISLGFAELLTSVATALERECVIGGDAARQLAHAAAALRDPRTALDIKITLTPLNSNFPIGTH